VPIVFRKEHAQVIYLANKSRNPIVTLLTSQQNGHLLEAIIIIDEYHHTMPHHSHINLNK
jgi:hypothetical protein